MRTGRRCVSGEDWMPLNMVEELNSTLDKQTRIDNEQGMHCCWIRLIVRLYPKTTGWLDYFRLLIFCTARGVRISDCPRGKP